jgi:hypothetical protein
MSDAVRVTHYKVIWDARIVGGAVVLRDDAGAQHEITVRDAAALGALVATLRSEVQLVYEPSSGRLYSAEWRPVGWMEGA